LRTLTYSDANSGDNLSFYIEVDGDPPPYWITLDGFEISFSPDANSLHGTYNVEIFVQDDNSIDASNGILSDTKSFTLTVI